MANEVQHAFDELFLDFIERNKVQIWYEQNGGWTVQVAKPFIQITEDSLKGAITKLMFKVKELKLT